MYSVPMEIEFNHAVGEPVEIGVATPLTTSNQESCVNAGFQGTTRAASTNSQLELRESSMATEPQDPLALAIRLAEQFRDLQSAGIRDRLCMFLQGNYLLGFFFKQCPEKYQRFKDFPYWHDVRQKPNDRNVMRSVLTFTMVSKKQNALQNRACKYGRVLEHFYEEEVVPDEVSLRLKGSGGVDAIYAALCRGAKPPEGRSDGLEEPANALPLAQTANGTADGTSGTSALPIQGLEADGETDGVDERALADERQRNSAVGSKRGPHDLINLYTTLAVEMSETQLAEVLRARRATIRIIIGPRDDGGWIPVRALSVLPSSSDEEC
jgi:hypothetical protein